MTLQTAGQDQKSRGHNPGKKRAVLEKQWNDLDETDTWMNYYFDANGFINRDRFIF